MPRLNKKTLDGNVDTLILVLLADGPNYGYRIVQQLNEKSPELLKLGEGTIYPVLHRLEERSLIRATWRKGETGRERKYYSLTVRGHRVLAENREQLRSLVRVMTTMLGPLNDSESSSGIPAIEGGIA